MSKAQGHLSDEARVGRARKLEAMRVDIQAADLRCLMSQAWGRRLMYRLTHEMGRLVAPSFAGNLHYGIDLHTARNEGIRLFAIELMTETQRMCPAEWITMLEERLASQRADDATLDQKTTATGDDNGD